MNCAEMMRSKGAKVKEQAPQRLKPLEIGEPQNFSHVVHVAPRPPLSSVNLNDPHIQVFLKQAGVTEDQLSHLEVYETIVNFIHVHGVDKVKKEAAADAPAVDKVDAPVEPVAPGADDSSSADEVFEKDLGEKMPLETKNKNKRGASPSLIARLFRGKKKQAKEGVIIQEELKEATTHQIEVEPVEAVEKVLDEEEKLVESEAENKEVKKPKNKPFLSLRPEPPPKPEKKVVETAPVIKENEENSSESEEEETEVKKAFSFRSEKTSTGDEKQEEEVEIRVKEQKPSFFSRHWGKHNKEEHQKKKIKEEVVVEKPEKPKKTAGIFKRNLKKTRISSSSDDDEAVSLKPDGDAADEIIIVAADDAPTPKPVSEKKFGFFKTKTKKSASVDQLQTEGKDAEHHQGSTSDDESAKETSSKQKRDFFRFKGKKAVSVDVHQKESNLESVAGPVASLLSFKSKRESGESQKSYGKLENEEKFDEVFQREAERASKLNIIPSAHKGKDAVDSDKRKSAENKKEKSATLDSRNSGGSGFFRLGSRKKTSISMDDVVVPGAPRNSLPEVNKHKVKKYKVKKMSATFYSEEALATSSDEHSDGKVVKRKPRKPKKSKKTKEDEAGHTTTLDEAKRENEGNVFTRIFSRRSMSETRGSKKDKKRRSSLDSSDLKEQVAAVSAEAVPGQEPLRKSATVEHIYENFPVAVEKRKDEDDKSTDAEADEYFAQYHNEKRELSNARRSWSFVMAELKEKMTSVDEAIMYEPVYKLAMDGDNLNLQLQTLDIVRLQEMKSDPNLADHHKTSSSSSDEEEDMLENIRKSVEKLDNEYAVLEENQQTLLLEATQEQIKESVHVEVSQEQPKSIIEDLIVPEKAPQKEDNFKNLPLPTRTKVSTSSEEDSVEISTVQEVSKASSQLDSSVQVADKAAETEHKTLSSSDSLEYDSLEPVTQSESVQSPLLSRSLSQDSLDSSRQDDNNNDGMQDKVELRSSSKFESVRTSLVSSTESRPLSDCQLKIADTIEFEEPAVSRQSKTSRRLERGSRVSKRPASSFSSSNEDSLPPSPVRKMVTEQIVVVEARTTAEKEEKSSSGSSTSSSSKGDSIQSSTENVAFNNESNKENVQMRRNSCNDDVFIPEEEDENMSPASKRASVERNASYHRAVEISSSLPLPRKGVQTGRRSSSNASRIPRPILKKPRRRTVDELPFMHRVTEL